MPDHPHPTPNVVTGIGLKLASVAVFTTMAGCIKATADHVPAGEAVFFRSAFALPPILIWMWATGHLRDGAATRNPLGHFWRGLVGVSAMTLHFAALGYLPFPDATAIGYAAPLFATILAAMFLGERLRAYRLSAVGVGLAGVFVILYPKLTVLGDGSASTAQTLGALLALTGAMCAAMAQVFVRKLVAEETTVAIVVWFSVTATVLSLLSLPFGWVVPSPREAGLLIVAGLLGGLGQILLTQSYRHAETAVIASFDYSSMLLAVLIGWFVFSEAPTATMLAGGALVVAAGLFVLFRERRLGIERARARKVVTPQG